MARRALTVVAAGALLVLALPSSSPAQCGDRVQGGNSEIDQYLESVPGACGDQRPEGGEPETDRAGSVPPSAAAALEALGPDGSAAAALAEATSAPDRDADPGDRAESAASDSPSGAAAVGQALSGSADDGGLGWLLPLILGLVAAGGAALVIVRRRRGGA
jgi:hypothetical protein